jgi:autotransporter-associated beta strand protein
MTENRSNMKSSSLTHTASVQAGAKQPDSYQLKPYTPATPSAQRAVPTAASHHLKRAWRPLARLAALACLLAVPVAQAGTTRTWMDTAGDLNWSNPLNWSGNVVPVPGDIAKFDTHAAVATQGTPYSCVVNASTNLLTVYLANSSPTLFHNIQIADGTTLLLSPAASGYALWSCPLASLPSASPITNTITGANGTIAASAGYWGVLQGGATPSIEVLDMSGLGTLKLTNATRIYIGAPGLAGTGSYTDRSQGMWKMAKTNIITLVDAVDIDFVIGQSSGSEGALAYVELGQTNAIFADVGVGVGMRGVNDCQMHFGPSFVNGYAYFRSRSGGRMAHFLMGDNNLLQQGVFGATGTGMPVTATVDFTGGTVDAQVSDLAVGRGGTNSSRTTYDTDGSVRGYLTFNRGVIDTVTAAIGYAPNAISPVTSGQVNVDGTGQLVVQSYMILGNFQNTNVASYAWLNIGTISGGGSVSVYGNLYTITNDLSAGTSPNDSEIHIQNAGSLYVKGGNVGPLNTFELNHSTLTLDYGVSLPTTAPVCVTSNLITGAGSTLNVQGTRWTVGQFPLILYQSIASGGGFSDITFNLPGAVEGYFSNNVANSSFDLVVTNVLISSWVGKANGVNNGNWDIAVTKNWKNQYGAASAFQQGNNAIFDDTATGATTVSLLASSLSPGSINVTNSLLTYTFTGSGGLAGIANLAKDGTGTLTIGNSGVNSFTGPIAIYGGMLQLSGSANRLPTNAAVTLADAAGVILDLNGQNQMLNSVSGGASSAITLGSGTLTLSGGAAQYDGVISGSGKLVKTNIGVSATQTLSGDNTYSGGTLISGSTTLTVINSSGSGLGSGNVDIENSGTLNIGVGGPGSIAAAAITNNGILNLNVNIPDLTFTPVLSGSGTFNINKSGLTRLTTPNGNYSGIISIQNGQVQVSDGAALGAAPGYTYIAGPAQLQIAGGVTIAKPLQMPSKPVVGNVENPAIVNVSGTNTLTGAMTLVSGGTLPSDFGFESDADKLVIRGEIINLGGSTRQYYLRGAGDGEVYSGFPSGVNNIVKDDAGTWTLWGTNLNSGATDYIYAGTLILNGINIASSVQVYSTLGGTGLITAPVVFTSGTLSPGAYPNTLGTLTVSNDLTLDGGSTSLFDVSASGSDSVRGLGTVTCAGALQVNLQGSITANAVYKLFDATNYAGAFDTITLPSLSAPFGWDTSLLMTNGTLIVTGGPPIIPHIGTFSFGGSTNFQMTGTGELGQSYRVLATTNVSLPLASWTQVGSGAFVGGVFGFMDTNAASYPHRFYRVLSP